MQRLLTKFVIMKKILFVLAALFMMAPMKTQTAQAQLRIDGNDYYYGDKELSNSELLQFYADQNCQAAYNQFVKGQKIAKTGWAFLGIGGGLGIAGGAILASNVLTNNTTSVKDIAKGPLGTAGLALGLAGTAFELASIPCLVVGYRKQHTSVNVYNAECATARIRPYWTLQSSANGIGLAMKF